MVDTITTVEELDRVHLRFIKVKDDARLTTILEKILPKMLVVYLESDMINVIPSNENAKLKAL